MEQREQLKVYGEVGLVVLQDAEFNVVLLLEADTGFFNLNFRTAFRATSGCHDSGPGLVLRRRIRFE